MLSRFFFRNQEVFKKVQGAHPPPLNTHTHTHTYTHTHTHTHTKLLMFPWFSFKLLYQKIASINCFFCRAPCTQPCIVDRQYKTHVCAQVILVNGVGVGEFSFALNCLYVSFLLLLFMCALFWVFFFIDKLRIVL